MNLTEEQSEGDIEPMLSSHCCSGIASNLRLLLFSRMSERYMLMGSKAALLLMVLVISVWEMSIPTEGATGELTETEAASGDTGERAHPDIRGVSTFSPQQQNCFPRSLLYFQ